MSQSEAVHHPLKENIYLDQAIEILKEVRQKSNIRYYDPNYRCLTCGRTGEEDNICKPSHSIEQSPFGRLYQLLREHPIELLHLCQHHEFSSEDIKFLTMGSEFGDQALIDVLLDNIFEKHECWENMDQLKEVLIPIFQLINYDKFVNIVIFCLRQRVYINADQFEKRFDWYQIVKLYVEIMFKKHPDLIEKLNNNQEGFREVIKTLPRIKYIDRGEKEFEMFFDEFKEDLKVFEQIISTYLDNPQQPDPEYSRTYAYYYSSTIQALQLHHYLTSMGVDFDDLKTFTIDEKLYLDDEIKEAIQFESSVPLSELIELFNNIEDSDNLPYQTLDYRSSFRGVKLR